MLKVAAITALATLACSTGANASDGRVIHPPILSPGNAPDWTNHLTEQARNSTNSADKLLILQRLNRREYTDALPRLRTMADSGNVWAMNLLGVVHDQGLGVPRDLQQSLQWFYRAAMLGDDRAELVLGVAFVRGHGVDSDAQIGRFWLTRAASGNDGAVARDARRVMATLE